MENIRKKFPMRKSVLVHNNFFFPNILAEAVNTDSLIFFYNWKICLLFLTAFGQVIHRDICWQVISEQELLSAQLLQKTEEINQLNAKLKLWELIRDKQESECKAHVEDMKNLKSEIKRLKYVSHQIFIQIYEMSS